MMPVSPEVPANLGEHETKKKVEPIPDQWTHVVALPILVQSDIDSVKPEVAAGVANGSFTAQPECFQKRY